MYDICKYLFIYLKKNKKQTKKTSCDVVGHEKESVKIQRCVEQVL